MLEKQGFVIGDCLRMPHDLQADVVLPIIKYAPFFLTHIFYILLRLRFARMCYKYSTKLFELLDVCSGASDVSIFR